MRIFPWDRFFFRAHAVAPSRQSCVVLALFFLHHGGDDGAHQRKKRTTKKSKEKKKDAKECVCLLPLVCASLSFFVWSVVDAFSL